MLSAGIKAPDFTIKDKDGKEVKLSSFLGRKVVLYFYPKDNTPGSPGRHVPLQARTLDLNRGTWRS